MSTASDIKAALDAAGFKTVEVVVDDSNIAHLSGEIGHPDQFAELSDVLSDFEVDGLNVDEVKVSNAIAEAMLPIIESSLHGAGFDQLQVSLEDGVVIISGAVADPEAEARALDIVEGFEMDGIDVDVEYTEVDWDGTEDVDDDGDPDVYVVKKGDSWWRIADNIWGDGRLWKKLKAANGNPKVIHPGQRLDIPDIDVA